MYSAKLLDHFNNPRNSGDLANPDVRVTRDNPVCGDIMELALQVDAGQITHARFKAQGCVPAVACASALTTMITGLTLEDAKDVGREDLLREVDGVPAASMHAVNLALDTLGHALAALP